MRIPRETPAWTEMGRPVWAMRFEGGPAPAPGPGEPPMCPANCPPIPAGFYLITDEQLRQIVAGAVEEQMDSLRHWVKEDVVTRIHGSVTSRVAQNMHQVVHGEGVEQRIGNIQRVVLGRTEEIVHGELHKHVKGFEHHEVVGLAIHSVLGALNLAAIPTMFETVGGWLTENVLGAKVEGIIGGGLFLNCPKVVHLHGSYVMKVAREIATKAGMYKNKASKLQEKASKIKKEAKAMRQQAGKFKWRSDSGKLKGAEVLWKAAELSIKADEIKDEASKFESSAGSGDHASGAMSH